MSYIEIKMVYGRKYKYLRKAVRDGKKVKHINLKYLGPVDPVYKIKQKRKPNASVYVRQLEANEIRELTIATKSTEAFKRDRAKILLFSSKKYTAKEIAAKIDCGVRKVRKAIKTFNCIGLKALERGKAKGAKPRFTKEQRAKIVATVFTDPATLGLHFTTWSLRKLKRYLIDKKIVDYISIFTIREILQQEGIKIKRSKRFQYSNDPEFAKKKLLIDTLRVKPPPNAVVLSFDEKGRTPIKKFGGRKWGDNNYYTPYKQKIKGLIDIFAAKNIHNGNRHYKFYTWKNSFIVIDFVDWLVRKVYPDKEVYLIHDNWSPHKSNTFYAYIDLQPRLHLVPLPTTCSWMNDIERDFSRLQREVLDNSNFENPKQAMERISDFFEKELNSI